MHARNSLRDTIRVHGYLFMYGILAYFFLWIFLGFWIFSVCIRLGFWSIFFSPLLSSIPPLFLFTLATADIFFSF